MKRRLSLILIVLGAVLLMPSPASAHAPIPGAGDLVNGLLHPVRSPVHMLIIVALSLFLGQQSSLKLLPSMIVFVICAGIAIGLADVLGLAGVYPPLMMVLAGGVGALVVFQMPAPILARVVLCAVAAVALGLDSASEAASTTSQVKISLGTWIILPILICDFAFYASLSQKHWVKVGLRVLGSWILAISLLMLAFYIKTGT